QRLYVLLHVEQGAVLALDLATRQVAASVPVGRYPLDFGMSRDGRWIVAASFDDEKITVIDVRSLQPIASYAVPTGFGLVVHPTEPVAYSMASFDNEVVAL